MANILEVVGLEKSFGNGDNLLQILKQIDFNVEAGEVFSIVGPSGSGKTTLLGICAGLDKQTKGKIHLCGTDLSGLNEDELARFRNQKVGFIFQDFQLLPTLTALENVALPLELQGNKSASVSAKELLDKVGLKERMNHYPTQLSGGEQQRVAMARAFANQPQILFADEPTGNLDDESGEKVIELLFGLNKASGTTLVIVTHDMQLAKRTNNILRLKGGMIQKEVV